MTAHGQLGPGTIVSGAYRIVRPLSEGGMGAVFVAEHVTTRKQRALKVMHGELLGDPQLRDRFIQEAQVGGRIESEHVVEVVDAGFDEALRTPWLAMELLEGESLYDKLERGAVPPAETNDLLQQLCHALGAAHRAGIVHRDLKPENVFISRSRRVGAPFAVKVLDFGIAKVVAEAKATRMATAAIGTPLWMAPEQTEASNRIVPATDVWAIGLLAFRMLTGKYYWIEAYRCPNNVGVILTEMLVKPIVAPSHRAAELGVAHLVPAGFDAWFMRAVDRDPNHRHVDANEAYATLAPLLGGPPTRHSPQTPQSDANATQGWNSGGYSPMSPPVSPYPQHGTQPSGQTPPQYAPPYTPQPPQQQYGHQPSYPQQQASGTMVFPDAHAHSPPPPHAHGGTSGTMVGAMPPHVQVTSQPPLVSPAFGIPARSATPEPSHSPSTPQQMGAAIPMNTGPTQRSSKPGSKTGGGSFAIGLGSVLVVGALIIGAIKLFGGSHTDPVAASESAGSTAPAPKALNKWIRVDPPKKGWYLGVDADTASPLVRGFRPARKIAAPFTPYEIQQHEVTWAELDAFLEGEKADGKASKLVKPTDAPKEGKDRATIPVTGVAWQTAVAYCKSIGGNLPTEEQWEYAARGKEHRKYAWGSESLDLKRTHAFASGSKAAIVPVMTSDQDHTPGDDPIFDLMGNAQEWTLDVYQDDLPDQDEGWTQSGGVTFRGVRGLPLLASPEPSLLAMMTAAYREPVCATGGCAPGGKGSGEAVTFLRTGFSSVPTDEAAPSRAAFGKAVAEAKPDLGTCAEKATDERGYLMKVEYKLPLKANPICRASDGYDDPIECCNGKTCPHAPHRLIRFDPAKLTVSGASEAGFVESAATTCAKPILEKKLATLKWPDAADEWTATIWIHRLEPKLPKTFASIGFRCVRPIAKGQ